MRILMTGATSGIGYEAAKRFAAAAPDALSIGARRPDAAPATLRAARFLSLDLASLASVRAFAAAARAHAPFDALVLNAGVQCVTPKRSADGYELTFAVNHLAHYLLARTLAEDLAEGGRIILTSSGTHDPEEKSGLPPPRDADAERLAFPDKDRDLDADRGQAGRRAYATSKLCNVMTARELARRLAPTRPDIMIAAFDPGFTPGTGLARNYPGPIGLIFRYALPLVVRRGDRVSTPANSGALLAGLVAGSEYSSARGGYFAVRGSSLQEHAPSTLARDDAACARLWDESARLVGLT